MDVGMLTGLLIFWFAMGASIIGLILCAIDHDDDDGLPILPKEIYVISKLNWAGSILLSILFFVLNPIIYIGKIIYWACHIKRKGE